MKFSEKIVTFTKETSAKVVKFTKTTIADKKKLTIAIAILAVIVIGLPVTLILALSGGENAPRALPVPGNVAIDAQTKTLTWDAVSDASGYIVWIDGDEKPKVAETSYSLAALTEVKTYSIKVKAKGDGKKSADSAYSDALDYTVTPPGAAALPVPEGVAANAQTKTLTWSAVLNASGYTVWIDGTEYSSNVTTYSLAALTAAKTYSIKVKAKGNGTTYSDSAWSNAIGYTVSESGAATVQLPVPSNIRIEGTTLKWNAVSNAYYRVSVNGEEKPTNLGTPSYSLSSLTAEGTYELRVIAKGNGMTYTDSEWSTPIEYKIEKLATPSGLSIAPVGGNQVLTWTAVPNAYRYVVSVGGTESSQITAASYTLSGSLTVGTPYQVKVKAIGNLTSGTGTGTTYLDSDWSGEITYTPQATPLPVPNNVRTTTGYGVAWDWVSNATSYMVSIDGLEKPAITIGSMFHSFDNEDMSVYKTYEVKVKAVGSGRYADSEWSEAVYYTPTESSGLSFTEGTDGYYLTGSSGVFRKNVFIMPEHNGKPVIAINYSAFSSNTKMETVYIPATVKSIGMDAFRNAANLSVVTFAEGSQLETIADSAFYNCKKLTSVSIPEDVTTIGATAFQNCSALESITFLGADKLTVIRNYAFDNCVALASIAIPKSVTEIGDYAFRGCSNLKSVGFGTNSALTSLGNSAFWNCVLLEEIIIPDGVTSIYGSFSGCESLKTVTFGNKGKLTAIGGNAFDGCVKLKNVVIPDGVTTLGLSAFRNCSGLESVVIPETVTYMGDSMGGFVFENCVKLTEVVIPSGVTNIGESTFKGCSALQSLTIPFVGSKLNKESDYDYYYKTHFGSIFGANEANNNAAYVPASLKTVIITGGTIIADNAFDGCGNIENITIANSVETVGIDAFKDTGIWTKAAAGIVYADKWAIGSKGTAPVGVLSLNANTAGVGAKAFFGYAGLTGVSLPVGVISVGVSAFENCSALASVNFAANDVLKNIGASAFKGCVNLENLSAFPTVLETIGESAFEGCVKLKSASFAANGELKTLGAAAFKGCVALTAAAVPNGVTEIGFGAFSGCSALESVTLPFVGGKPDGTDYRYFGYIFDAGNYYGQNTSIPASLKTVIISGGTVLKSNAFYGCAGLTNITLPDGLTEIQGDAFTNCGGLTNIVIPNSVTYIAAYAFSGCTGLKSITIPFVGTMSVNGTETYFGSLFGWGGYVGGNFNGNSDVPASLKTVIISGGSSIADNAFSGCNALKEIVIPDSVISIGSAAFSGCSSLESVAFGAGSQLQTLGGFAFNSCDSLTSIEIPAGVTVINNYAISYCNNLTSITIRNQSEVLTLNGAYAIYNCASLTDIYVPASLVNAYKADASWSAFADKIKPL
jgi:hypothetical protein